MSSIGSLSDVELIQGKRIYLRLMRIADQEAYSKLYCDDVQMQFVCAPLNQEKANTCLKRSIALNAARQRQHLYLSICTVDTDAVVGFCGLAQIDYRAKNVELGVSLLAQHSKNGFAEESLWLLIQLCRELLPGFQISGILHSDNKAAQNLVKKVGYKLVTISSPWQLWIVND
ncbi:GNAT family N-acetyltransferase [Rheinheimera sp.]|uniref:GNAT family N-acetyltransferase n=1 Tax=Rheinheimera sp. TaxID=1869214 RepID=UPI003FA7C46C